MLTGKTEQQRDDAAVPEPEGTPRAPDPADADCMAADMLEFYFPLGLPEGFV